MSIKALPLHNSIGLAVVNLFQEHFDWQKIQAPSKALFINKDLYWNPIISSHGNPHTYSHEAFLSPTKLLLHLWKFQLHQSIIVIPMR